MLARLGRRLLAAFVLLLVATALGRGQDAAPAHVASLPPSGANLDFSHPAAATRDILAVTQSFASNRGPLLSTRIVPAAGIIFSGHVTAVSRGPSPAGTTSASTVITFHVDEGIRGTSTGQMLTIREWEGLWDRGEQYRIGEGVFLFLYPPSRLGLTSPVGGSSGRFAVDWQRRIVMNARNLAALADDPDFGGKLLVPYANFRRAVLRSAVTR